MEICKCGLGESDNHESALKANNWEIRRLMEAEPLTVAKPKVIKLMKRNISITNCIGEDVSYLESKLAEYENKKGIRKRSQLGPRKMDLKAREGR